MLSLFPRDVLDEIWDCIESVPEDFSYLLLHKFAENKFMTFKKSFMLFLSKSVTCIRSFKKINLPL